MQRYEKEVEMMESALHKLVVTIIGLILIVAVILLSNV